MLVDDEIKLVSTSNVVVGSLPALPVGEENSLVYLTEQDGSNEPGLYLFTGGQWVVLSGEEIITAMTGILLHTIDNPNAYGTSAGDRFGWSVSVSGNRCIIGAFLEADSGGLESGKAYIYDTVTGNLLHILDNPNARGTSAGDRFGWSVGISGDYCIAGAHPESDASGSWSGKAYIFNVTTGNLVHILDNPNAYGTSTNDQFGYTVDIDGNRCIVGAFYEGDSGGTDSGKAYIFDVTTGALLHTLDNPNAYGTSTGDRFGATLAISGNHCIVGAYDEDDGLGSYGGTSSGKAYIFNVNTGALVHTLSNPNAYGVTYNDKFSGSVAIDGNHCIVGASQEGDSSGGTNSGKAYIFDVTTGNLVHILNNPNASGTSTNDRFGFSVGISGNTCVVGAYGDRDTAGTSYVFDVTTGLVLHTLNNPSPVSYDSFGYSIAVDGNTCAVGAYRKGDAGGAVSGKTYIFV